MDVEEVVGELAGHDRDQAQREVSSPRASASLPAAAIMTSGEW
jgi:hypothetical protein